ncbi:hypothetical protein NEOC65_000428 [Neochlamydia sp. AcF65]|uniref:hypothetical protein n=1 Tax=Neochlamydia sp. AcF65 TaxID=2795735 RepID=UPI001BC8DA35|nr:hypothetical protein [Neochlamydia sp. AcF65]MBS4165371.1 hypothetical protein [Neochlamydia sp. AcF65]
MHLENRMRFSSNEKILYKNYDDRINIHHLDIELSERYDDLKAIVPEQTKSVACMIGIDQFEVDPISRVYRLNAPTLNNLIKWQHGYPLAADEKFGGELAPGFGTAFAVSKNVVYTAAHCICKLNSPRLDEARIEKIRFIFNFRIHDDGQIKTEYEEKDIYKIKKISSYKWAKGEDGSDWACIKLDVLDST